MNNRGYVYVLINPSIKGMVKIGKTTRTPEIRAEELSASTGVPTPFIVVYSSYFEDCSEAEKFVHTYLENDGFRVSSKREFFEIKIQDAINAILKTIDFFADSQKQKNLSLLKTPTSSTEIIEDGEIWQDTFDKANKYFFGYDEIIDYVKALKYYLLSIKLGSLESFSLAGLIYEIGGYGVKKDLNKALSYYNKGTEQGYPPCWVNLAMLYEKKNELDNAEKSWNKYFTKCSNKDIDLNNCYYYIVFIFNNNFELKHIELLNSKKEDIELMIFQFIEDIEFIENLDVDSTQVHREMYKSELDYIDENLTSSNSNINKFLTNYNDIMPDFITLNYFIFFKDFLENNETRLKGYMFQFLKNISYQSNENMLKLIMNKKELFDILEGNLAYRAIEICISNTLEDTYLDYLEIDKALNKEEMLDKKILKLENIIFENFKLVSKRISSEDIVIREIIRQIVRVAFLDLNNISKIISMYLSYSLYHTDKELIYRYNSISLDDWKYNLIEKAKLLCEKDFPFLDKKYLPNSDDMIVPIIQYMKVDEDSDLYTMKIIDYDC